ncbi:MAG: alpha/beta fold hydrolase [Chloroflexota bacterium]
MGAYEEGLELWRRVAEQDEGLELNPACASQALLHGRRTPRATVLLHGITNCPHQWVRMAAELHAGGRNVLVPRLPRHGLRDRLTRDPARQTAAELAATATATVHAAARLGERVTVVGLSLGGVLAAWLAERSAEVDAAVLVAPLLGIRHVPRVALPWIGSLATRGPNLFVWWDRAAKSELRPEHGYPRVATRAFGALLRLAGEVEAGARRPPQARVLVVVTNAADPAVDNRATQRLAARWRAQGARVAEYVFPESAGLPHDLVDPANPEQAVERVYPVVLDLVSAAEAGTGAGTPTR